MDFICMDLIGEFHPPTKHGHHFALTACCMLTGFTWCVPLKTKTADEVVTAYKNHIACPFGGSVKILMDNGTEFKNKLFKEVVTKLGTEMSVHSPLYSNGCSGGLCGTYVSSPRTLSSPLSKGEIIGSTGISLFGLSAMSVGSSDCLLLSLSLFSLSTFSCSSS